MVKTGQQKEEHKSNIQTLFTKWLRQGPSQKYIWVWFLEKGVLKKEIDVLPTTKLVAGCPATEVPNRCLAQYYMVMTPWLTQMLSSPNEIPSSGSRDGLESTIKLYLDFSAFQGLRLRVKLRSSLSRGDQGSYAKIRVWWKGGGELYFLRLLNMVHRWLWSL